MKAERRWAITGTPLQNKLGDLFGLMVFLGLKPLNDKSYWNPFVERPLKNRQETGLKTLKVGRGLRGVGREGGKGASERSSGRRS